MIINDDDNDDDDNIFFSIREKDTADNNDVIEIDDSISEMTANCDTPSILNVSTDGYLYSNLCGAPLKDDFYDDFYNGIFSLTYYKTKEKYNEDEHFYYESEYTVKDLMKICEYYKIDKQVKGEKNKKLGIISAIVFFESLAENQHIVIKRHEMWAYMDALRRDENMRKYIIWN